MSTSAPRWKTALETAIFQFKNQTVFQLSTLESGEPPQVHVRSHVFRSFLSSPAHPHLPLLLSSTDIRTPKVAQITSTPQIELAWWIEGKQQQFRITGRASVIPAPSQTQMYGHFYHVVRSRFQVEGEEGRKGDPALLAMEAVTLTTGFDWEQKRVETFKKLSPYMKASWCRPTPGSKLEGGEDEAKKWPTKLEEPTEDSSEEDKKNWDTALNNFALIVIEPVYVDFVDLGVAPNRRIAYKRDEKGQWDETELVP